VVVMGRTIGSKTVDLWGSHVECANHDAETHGTASVEQESSTCYRDDKAPPRLHVAGGWQHTNTRNSCPLGCVEASQACLPALLVRFQVHNCLSLHKEANRKCCELDRPKLAEDEVMPITR
jgi:hypothetical protein